MRSIDRNRKSFKKTNPLTLAFKALRSLGYFARQDFMCCQSCAWSEVPDGKEDKVVFYHRQDKQGMLKDGECYLGWAGDGTEICYTLRSFGFTVEWDGSDGNRILIKNIF